MDSHDFNKNLEKIINNFLTNFSKNKEKNFENYSIFEKNLIHKKYKTNNERYFKKLIKYKNSDKKKEINMNSSNNNDFENNNNYINNINANDSDKIKEILKNPSENFQINNSNNVNFNININSIHNIILPNNNDYILSNKSISLNENEETKNEFEKIINLLESKKIEYTLNFKQDLHKMKFKIKKQDCFYDYSLKINTNKKIIFIEKIEKRINKLKNCYKIEDNTIQNGINELINLLNN